MKKITKLCAAATSASLLATSALAGGCMKPEEKTALKISTLQQELMVAALTCNDAAPYNAFVLANRPELVQSDQELQAFYTGLYQGGGTAQFQTVKTRLANHFSLDSLHNEQGFCQNAAAIFAGLNGHLGTPLATQVSWMPMSISDTQESCERGAPIVETVQGGTGNLPVQREAEQAPPPSATYRHAAEAAENDGPPAPPPPSYYAPPPPAQRVAQNYYGAPPPSYYWQGPGYYYPPNYYWQGPGADW